MKKKILLTGFLITILLTGCGIDDGNSVSSIESTPETEAVTIQTSSETAVESTPEIETVTIQTSSETATEVSVAESPNFEKIYVQSFKSGYISGKNKMNSEVVYMAENAEHVKYIKENWLNSMLDEFYIDDGNNTSPVKEFDKILESYPEESYVYFLQYDEVGSTGYYIHCDRFSISDCKAEFIRDDTCITPSGEVGEAMDGFFHIAAVPRELIGDTVLKNVVYPE